MVKQFKDKNVDMDAPELKEVDTSKEPCSIVFIGHVDAGKSTICGNLMYQMGVVDERVIEKYKREAKDKGRDSWWLAYVMDSSDEEKAKGKTVEVGRAFFETANKKFTILDAPGHKTFVTNMIMGAAVADVGALVISARKGEYESGFEKDGQTREHTQLAKSLGVQKLVVIVNKMDQFNWSKGRFDEIQTGLLPFLVSTGFAEKDLIWVPIVGLSGDNLKEKPDKKEADWYKGPTLIEALNSVDLGNRDKSAPLRVPILDKMKIDNNLVVYGKVESGSINIGDKLAIMPSGAPAQVLKVYDSTGNFVKVAYPGENVELKLNIADEEQIQRGCVLSHRDSMMPVSELFEAELQVLELLKEKPIITGGYTAILHMHTIAEEVEIKTIIKAEMTNEKGAVTTVDKPKFVKGHCKIQVRIVPSKPIALEKFETMPNLGCFTLRDKDKTICIGRVLKYKPFAKGVVGGPAVTKQLGAMKLVDATGGKVTNVTQQDEKA
jgi:peptide chain release factor subunit 3